MKLRITETSASFDPQGFVQFLEFLNTKFTKLNLFIFNNHIDGGELIYDDYNGFNMPPSVIQNLLDYKDKFSAYNNRINTKLRLTYEFKISTIPNEIVQNYIEQLGDKLSGFGKSSWMQNRTTYYEFRKFNRITETITVEHLLVFCHTEEEIVENVNADAIPNANQNINPNNTGNVNSFDKKRIISLLKAIFIIVVLSSIIIFLIYLSCHN